MSGLLELAERCEKAEGPDRELDALIVTTLCPDATVSEYIAGEGDDIVFHAEALGIRNKDCCPWYTHSIDAALTLVPDGWRILSADFSITERVSWMLQGPIRHYVEPDGYECDAPAYIACCAPTPALALCAAALRARAGQ